MPYIIDADDFYEGNDQLALLREIKRALPDFKITVFTVIGRCSYVWLREIKEDYSWIDMVPHGLLHETSRECERWDYAESIHYLKFLEPYDLTKGFKAPGWQISNDMYQALKFRKYWVADQAYNDARRPADLPAYILDAPNKLHFHIQDVCGNGLGESLPIILGLNNNQGFEFIKNVI